jgi:hypothetical protein
MIIYDIKVSIRGYIAHPYWPAREKVINIVKESGMSRARSAVNRRAALEQYLKTHDMTPADFEDLEAEAERPFYADGEGRIIVPALHVTSMLVATCDTISAAARPMPADQVRSLVTVSPWTTTLTGADGTWERFAVVTGGTGGRLTNQRALRSNAYIGALPEDTAAPGVPASGTITLDPGMVRPAVLEEALRYAGRYIGVGASRKMGWGRFTVGDFSARVG